MNNAFLTDPTKANEDDPFIFSVRELSDDDTDEFDEWGVPIVRIDPESDTMQRLYVRLGRIASLGALLEWWMAGVYMKLQRSSDPSLTQGMTFRRSWEGSSRAAQAIGGQVEDVVRPVLDSAMSAWLSRGKLLHGNWVPGELLGREAGTLFLSNPRRSGVAIDALSQDDVERITAEVGDAAASVSWLYEALHLVEVEDPPV